MATFSPGALCPGQCLASYLGRLEGHGVFFLLQVALKQQGQAAALFKEALLHNPDDWTSLQSYLDCILTQTTQVVRNDGAAPGTGDECGSQGAEELNGGLLQGCDHHQVYGQPLSHTCTDDNLSFCYMLILQLSDFCEALAGQHLCLSTSSVC